MLDCHFLGTYIQICIRIFIQYQHIYVYVCAYVYHTSHFYVPMDVFFWKMLKPVFNNMRWPQGWTLYPRGNVYPLRTYIVNLHRGENSVMFKKRRGEQRVLTHTPSPLGDSVLPWGPTSHLGVKFPKTGLHNIGPFSSSLVPLNVISDIVVLIFVLAVALHGRQVPIPLRSFPARVTRWVCEKTHPNPFLLKWTYVCT
jgi:hypothetical protein